LKKFVLFSKKIEVGKKAFSFQEMEYAMGIEDGRRTAGHLPIF
jgi:hypothetical protein